MTSRLLVALLLCAADALHYLEGSAGSTEEIFASGTYSYAPQQYILYGIEYDHSAGFSGGNLTYGNISGPVLLLKREEICDMRPNFKYEDKVVAVNLPDMDILACTSYTTGGSIEVLKPLETYGAVGILILNPDRPMAGVRWIRRYNNYPLDSYDFSVPVVGISNNDAASQLLQTLILAESPVVVSLYHEVNIWVTAANTPFFFVYNWLLVIVLNCVLLIFALYIFYVFLKEARPPARRRQQG